MRRLPLLAGLSLALGATAWITPSVAEACGGTFCDAGPQGMPVDQTGENILFHISDTHVEAHIQIQYEADDASQFAWVIPVMAVPEFEVGSQILFDNVLAGSVPFYGFNTTQEDCGDGDSDAGGSGLTAGDTGGDGDGDGDGDEGGEGPDVVYEAQVGAYDIVVLEGGTVDEVVAWLDDNGYQQDPNAEPILGEYLDAGFMFAAVKLTAGNEVDEIHPLVMRYEGNEPCVPIRLTRIAASDDMDIRAFFLGDARVVPQNYRHVLVNPLMLDWFSPAASYKQAITASVDADVAEGNAFVTEYAGDSSVVQTWNLYSESWDEAPLLEFDASPVGVIQELTNQGIVACGEGWGCEWSHPLLRTLVTEYIPLPDGMEEGEFYGCLDCNVDVIDLDAWDAQAFADAYRERVIDPGLNARNLVDENPYLTRMYTTISPTEMYEDPIFVENTGLPDVTNQNIANRVLHCDGTATMELPDGREVFLPDPNTWPEIHPDMPWEEKVSQRAADEGPMMDLVDRSDEIDTMLAQWNYRRGEPVPGGNGSCACSTDGGQGGFGWLAAGLGLLVLGAGRRRRG